MARRGEARQLADTNTGEELWLAERQRPTYAFRPDSQGRYYVMLGALAAENLEHSSYDGGTLRLLMHLIRTNTDPTGLVESTQKDLAAKLGVTQASISRSMKKLQEGGHVYKKGRSFFLNPETAFKGTGAEHQEAVARVPAERRLLAVVQPLRPDGA